MDDEFCFSLLSISSPEPKGVLLEFTKEVGLRQPPFPKVNNNKIQTQHKKEGM
jgi:hypothetical protein